MSRQFILLPKVTAATIAALAVFTSVSPPAVAAIFSGFTTVVNNGLFIPETQTLFNSYNPPSVNDNGLVVFRARSQGGGGQPISGIFTRDMQSLGSIQTIATRDTLVPSPNNTGATFNEFPSFPRIDSESDMIAFRGQSPPAWEYQLPDDSDSRVGTAGVYTNPIGSLITGVNQLGFLADFDYFQVPGAPAGTKFDQFPGAPSPIGGNTIVSKGNWTDLTDPANPIGKTGVYFRNVLASGGTSPVKLIADSNTLIPGTTTNTKFGSTAPPSAALGQAVFLGVDNEENPTEGGIYRALLSDPTILNTVIALGATVAGSDKPISKLGEALSFDGKYVAYWGALGTDTRTITLVCPTEGNADRVAYCNEQNPDGFTTEVPAEQGIFITNVETLETRLVAKAGPNEDFADFLFWNFSGRPPGVGEGDEEGDLELARWRSTSFVATDGPSLVFKALKALDSGIEGLYASHSGGMSIETIVDTSMLGEVLDPLAAGLPITALGIERDGFRNGQLVLNASMANEEESWAGVYYSRSIPTPALLPGVIVMGVAALRKKRTLSKQGKND